MQLSPVHSDAHLFLPISLELKFCINKMLNYWLSEAVLCNYYFPYSLSLVLSALSLPSLMWQGWNQESSALCIPKKILGTHKPSPITDEVGN